MLCNVLSAVGVNDRTPSVRLGFSVARRKDKKYVRAWIVTPAIACLARGMMQVIPERSSVLDGTMPGLVSAMELFDNRRKLQVSTPRACRHMIAAARAPQKGGRSPRRPPLGITRIVPRALFRCNDLFLK
jgi:hypothetical protein